MKKMEFIGRKCGELSGKVQSKWSASIFITFLITKAKPWRIHRINLQWMCVNYIHQIPSSYVAFFHKMYLYLQNFNFKRKISFPILIIIMIMIVILFSLLLTLFHMNSTCTSKQWRQQTIKQRLGSHVDIKLQFNKVIDITPVFCCHTLK